MSVEGVKQLLHQLQSDSPEIRVKNRHYKAACSRAVWALFEQVNIHSDRLDKLSGQMEQMLQLMLQSGIRKPNLTAPSDRRKTSVKSEKIRSILPERGKAA
jgi:hypothetical protein